MPVFDFHINPKQEKNNVLKTFYFQPEEKDQEFLGNLCVVGELVDAVSQDKNLLKDLAEIIKSHYYSCTDKAPEDALKQALKQANQYLEKLNKQGNIRWLGKLNVTALSFGNLAINFSKAGRIRLLLLRGNEYLDIGENLEFQSVSGSSVKTFSNVASGRLQQEDKIIVLTRGIEGFFEAFVAEELISLAPVNQKALDKLIKKHKEHIKRFSGIFFLAHVSKTGRRRALLRLPKISFPGIRIPKPILLIIIFILILLFSYFIFKH